MLAVHDGSGCCPRMVATFCPHLCLQAEGSTCREDARCLHAVYAPEEESARLGVKCCLGRGERGQG